MKLPKKNLLVTGSAGYIGSKFSYSALDNGFNLNIVDNLSTGFEKLIPRKSIFYNCNLNNKSKVDKILKKHNIKSVVHFAGSLSVKESMSYPLEHYTNNSFLTQNLIKLCVKNKIHNFIYSSTVAVYRNSKFVISEKTKCILTSYCGISKLLAEKLLINEKKKNNFSFRILRYFNVIGEDLKLRTGLINNNDSLLSNLVRQLIKIRKKINIYGNIYKTHDGTCLRDYIDINDLSKIYFDVLNKIKKNELLILNCSYGKTFSVLKVISKFEKIIKTKIKKIYKDPIKGGIEKKRINNKKLLRLINKKFKFDITKSLNYSLKW